jgi:hypothetical protein
MPVKSKKIGKELAEREGLISHSRGDVEIVDRPKLEEAACECYGIMLRQIAEWQGQAQ